MKPSAPMVRLAPQSSVASTLMLSLLIFLFFMRGLSTVLRAIVLGLVVMMAGCLTILPATWVGLYSGFLASLFVLAGGITLLQVVAPR